MRSTEYMCFYLPPSLSHSSVTCTARKLPEPEGCKGKGGVITRGASTQHPTASELHINTLGPRDRARVS